MATADIGSLRTRLSWESDDANKSLEGFKRDLKGLRSEMNLAKSHGKDYTNSLKGMREQSDILSRRFKTQEERVKELRKRYDESVKVKGEDAVATKELQNQLINATAEMNRTENQLKNLNAEIKRMESPWTKLGENMTKTGEKFQTVGKHMTDFGKSYSMRVTAPIVAGGIAVFKAASDYESAFAGVRKTVNASEEEFAALSSGIREMAKVLPASATEIAGVAEAAGQLGIENDSILSFTRTIIDLGESTNLSLEQASSEFARFANIVGMSQKDFDRLGSSTVALGNTMATTESEIVSLAMRLAAQGKQVGMTEAQIMALSATMSSLGISAEAGGTAMTTVLKKIDKAVDAGGKSLKGFADAAGVSSKEFADTWNKDPIKALDTFIKGLSKSGEEGENLSTILADLGIKGIREADAILRMAGASDLLSGAVNTSTKAWKENTALTEEAAQRYATTESQLKIMWNRVKDIAITLGNALIPAVMSAIDAAGPLIKQIESGAKAFSEMDEEQQRTIIKMLALTAAIGPASIALGGMTTAVGGVLKVGGNFATMLGKGGGAGLLGRIALLGPAAATPVGAAVIGVGALAGIMYVLNEASKESIQDSLKLIQSKKDEVLANEELINSFEELQKKNKLSTDEVLRYMDIMTELKNAETEKAIKALTDEQAALLEKSGFTNDEMEEFLRLNGEIVKNAPATAKAISEQGNAYVDVLEKVKELNQAERERLTSLTYDSIKDELRNQEKHLEKQKQLTEEINGLESERESKGQEITRINRERRDLDQEILNINEEIENATDDNIFQLYEKLDVAERNKGNLDEELSILLDQERKLDNQINKKKESLSISEKELQAFNELTDEYAQMILYEAGIVSEKGKANDAIKEQQKELDKTRRELEKLKGKGEEFTGEYEAQNKKLNEQQRKLDAAKQKLSDMNKLAGQTVYKDVKVSTDPSISRFNELLSQAVTKRVNLDVSGGGGVARISAYAKGTDNHHGGPFIAGEEGFELGRLGNRWEMLNLGMYDRPPGYEVFTHDESKKILSALNRMPAYADGVSRPGEANRVVNQLNNQQNQKEKINNQPITLQLIVDGEMLGEAALPHIDTMQGRQVKVNLATSGVFL